MRYIALLLLVVVVGGCASVDTAEGSYMSGETYTHALPGADFKKKVSYQGIDRSPVVVVHGFLGARLMNLESNKNVWGEVTVAGAIREQSNEELRSLALPMAIGAPLDTLYDNVIPDGLLTKFKVKFSLFEFDVDGYDRLIELLESVGYQREGGVYRVNAPYPTLFVYDYDWRRDISENAINFGRFLKKKKLELENSYRLFYGEADYDVKFNVIGHSMGGLVARYYAEYGDQKLLPNGPLPKLNWQGARYIEQLIQIGTPNGGYVDTCVELVNGLKYAAAAAPFPAGMIGTFHSYYQMMPHMAYAAVRDCGEVIDIYDVESWVKYKWGILSEEQDSCLKVLMPEVLSRAERYKIALDHLTKCLAKAKQFSLAMTAYAEPPKDVKLRLFLGDSVRTSSQVEYNHDTKKLDIIKYDTGDGKVLASSARANLRELDSSASPFDISPVVWSSVIHLPGAHMGIIKNSVFKDNLIYYLLASPQSQDIERIKKQLKEYK